jgi:hypothetical protein
LFSKKLIAKTEIINLTFKRRRSKSSSVFPDFSSEQSKNGYIASKSNNVSSHHLFLYLLRALFQLSDKRLKNI